MHPSGKWEIRLFANFSSRAGMKILLPPPEPAIPLGGAAKLVLQSGCGGKEKSRAIARLSVKQKNRSSNAEDV
jgi:hypothetical protein